MNAPLRRPPFPPAFSHRIRPQGPGLGAGLAALALALPLSAGSAAAATCDVNNFSGATHCAVSVPGGNGGNVGPEQMNAGGGLFDISGWMELSRIGSAAGSGTQPSDNALFSFTYTQGGQGGTWSLNPDWDWGAGSFAVALKGATDNVVYLLDGLDTAGHWSVQDLSLPNATGNGQGNGPGNSQGNANRPGNGNPGGRAPDLSPDLSNVTLFGTVALSPRTPVTPPPADTPAPIPLPAAVWLLLGGLGALGGLAGLRLRRRTA